MRAPSRVVGPIQLANATATLYTVPASTILVIRHIHLSNPTGGAVTATLAIGSGATAANRILDAQSIPAAGAGVTGNVLDLYGPWTLAAAEILAGFAGAATSIVITVDGDLLTLGW